MKKILAIIAAVLSVFCMTFATTACQKDADTIVIGITDYAPMDYNEDGVWKGFDYELATKTFTELGYKVKFQEIDWDTKIITLNSKEIDCIWNGMTVTEDLKTNLTLSNVYLQNKQYGLVNINKASEYTSKDALATAKVAVEGGSAAEVLMKDTACSELRKCSKQTDAVMEAASGTSDVAVVDYLLAMNMTSATSQFADKLVAVDLGFSVEEFAIGFRKADTDLCAKVNEKIAGYYADGTIKALAEKYGIENQLVA